MSAAPLAESHDTEPDEAIVDRSVAALDRKQSAAMLIVTLGVVSLAAACLMWLDARADNDALRRRGSVVSAQVVGVRTLGPDVLLVSFDHGGDSFTDTITAGRGTTFDETMLGEYVDVLFDPGNPGLIRLQTERNMPPVLPVWALVSLAFVVRRAVRLPVLIRAKHVAKTGTWTLAFVNSTQGKATEAVMLANLGSRRRKIAFLARSDGRSLGTGIVVGGKQANSAGELAWFTADGALAVSIAENRDPVVVKLRR